MNEKAEQIEKQVTLVRQFNNSLRPKQEGRDSFI